jgi:serine/threonine-protein kinase
LHGDLKPSNILLTRGGDAKLGDLALARVWDPKATQAVDASVGAAQGTPAYMSPEELLTQPRSPQSDVYAVGAILVEAVTGSYYVGAEHAGPDTLRRAILRGRLPNVDDWGRLGPVCRKALARNPAERFGSASAMREAILETVSEEPIEPATASFEVADLDPAGTARGGEA